MKRIILSLIAMLIGLSAHAFSWQNLIIPSNQTYQPYQQLVPAQVAQPAQAINYSAFQPYAQSYNQGNYQNPYQRQYANPYQSQYQGQYANPYQYQSPYGYGSSLPSMVSGLGNTGGSEQVMKNIGESMIYSMIRSKL